MAEPSDVIRIRGARQHNLKNVTLELPRGKFIVITGVSGSGKSSLAFDTLYAEGQRRYIESLSSYARQFLGQLDKPDVDAIEGLSPSIAIEQRSGSSPAGGRAVSSCSRGTESAVTSLPSGRRRTIPSGRIPGSVSWSSATTSSSTSFGGRRRRPRMATPGFSRRRG